MKIKLRPYQEELIQKVRESFRRGNKKVLMQLPTGGGKTVIAAFIMESSSERRNNAWFIVHQNELLVQTSESFWRYGIEHGRVVPGKTQSTSRLQVCSLQTLTSRNNDEGIAKRIERMKKLGLAPDIIIIDEAHRSNAETYKYLIEQFPKAKILGLTATPERTDGQPLGDVYEDLVLGPAIRWLMDEGNLCDFELYAPPVQGFDESKLKVVDGDYSEASMKKAMKESQIIGDAVTAYKQYSDGEIAVAACYSVDHAKKTAEKFEEAGISAVAIHGGLSKEERRKIIDGLKSGKFKVVCAKDLMAEGIDIPEMSTVIWMRPTTSVIKWFQTNGRALRPHPSKKVAKIIDLVQNWRKHPLPDEDVEWSLKGRKKGKKSASLDDAFRSKQCECNAISKSTALACWSCGKPFPIRERPEIEQVEGEVVHIPKEVLVRQRKAEQASARGLEQLIRHGIARGMKHPGDWAANVHAARTHGGTASQEEKRKARELMKQIKLEAIA